MPKSIIAIVGPKGGVGKSTISCNLAVCFAEMGRKVTAVDLDLGGPNLHVLLGIKHFHLSLDDFILKKVKDLGEVVIETGVRNLRLICGGSKIPELANMPFQQKMKLLGHIVKLEDDILILDLAAGSSYNVIDFLTIAGRKLMVTSPEMPSVIKVYGFIKSCIFRLLTIHFKAAEQYEILEILEKAKDPDANPHLKTVTDILTEAAKVNADCVAAARKDLEKFSPDIVINMAHSEREIAVGHVIQSMLKQYLSVSPGFVSIIPADTLVRKALMQNTPMVIAYPGSDFSRAIKRFALQCV